MATPAQSALSKLPLPAKIGVGAALSAVVMFAYWFIFYSDVSSKIVGAEQQKKTLHDQLTQQQQAQATYFTDRAELALREQRARDLNKVLPPDAEEDAFLSSVQQASNVAGIDLKGYAPVAEVPLPFYAKIPMKIELTGKFHQIAKFAYELGKVDRVINVENIELADPSVVGDEVVLKGRCLATAFHAVAPAAPRGGPGVATSAPGVAPASTAAAAPGGAK
jgi:type IV pilus assembly protein PilO